MGLALELISGMIPDSVSFLLMRIFRVQMLFTTNDM